MKLWLGAVLCTLLVSSTASFAALNELAADGSVALPSDLGEASIAASRRELAADVQDWTDLKADNQSRKWLACSLAGAEAEVAGLAAMPASFLATLTITVELERYLDFESQAVVVPLSEPLATLVGKVAFTPAELKTLHRLMTREVQDLTDRTRLEIDAMSFLMGVSYRINAEQVQSHIDRTHGLAGLWNFETEYCAALTAQAKGMDDLIAASKQVGELYDYLEQQLQQ